MKGIDAYGPVKSRQPLTIALDYESFNCLRPCSV